jgi:hypothetical protein
VSIKFNSKVLVSAATTVTGDWYLLDYKFNGSQERAFMGTLTSAAVSASDTIVLQVTPDEDRDSIVNIVDVSTFVSGSFSGILHGPWTYVRAVKNGAGGVGLMKIVG